MTGNNSRNDGTDLEAFVRNLERLLLPEGFEVIPNEKVYNDDGKQMSELDIQILGRVGTTRFKGLIECRDRQSEGAAPGSWIEQLVTRKDRFKFSEVIAVSTTGFSPSAIDVAERYGIELRTLTAATAEDCREWLEAKTVKVHRLTGSLKKATLIPDSATPRNLEAALHEANQGRTLEDKVLQPTDVEEPISAVEAYQRAVTELRRQKPHMFKVGETTDVRLDMEYTNDNAHFVVETKAGHVRIRRIRFAGTATLIEEIVPLQGHRSYDRRLEGQVIAQSVGFTVEVNGQSRQVSITHDSETGNLYLTARNPNPDVNS